MKSFLMLCLFAVPMASLLVWHLVFLFAVNQRFANHRAGQGHGRHSQ
ncbi:MAG: hypothetical protein PW789_12435 [Edaphobacter sp.]|nr:hypothetical protein [Edaphobacter sp.]MDE1177391.1 hypothetical protein [Edaphobacter sp.]